MNQDAIIKKVNDAVIEGISKKGMKWFKPWKSGQANAPRNRATGRYYNGFNVFFLNCVMEVNDFKYNQWLTYKQVKSLGGTVIKGSKQTDVYLMKIGYQDMKTGKYLKPAEIKEVDLNETFTNDKGEEVARYRETFTWMYYKVYNIGQTEGIKPLDVIEDNGNDNQPIEVAENLVQSYIDRDGKLRLVHKVDQAYYRPADDVVNMPKLETFVDSDSYYKTLFHELAHSTGHESRLNRSTLLDVNKWGDDTYAQEELVAEICAMYLEGFVGLNPKDTEQNSIAYIKGWVKRFKDKPKQCFFAMQQASKASAYILG